VESTNLQHKRDEIEKGLSGTGSSNYSDAGTASRVFGTFLQWFFLTA